MHYPFPYPHDLCTPVQEEKHQVGRTTTKNECGVFDKEVNKVITQTGNGNDITLSEVFEPQSLRPTST